MSTFTITPDSDLPIVQRRFMQHFDGTLESAVAFPELGKILNPTYSAHKSYEIIEPTERQIQRNPEKYLDVIIVGNGKEHFSGNQTMGQMKNAEILARELTEFINQFNPKPLGALVSEEDLKAMPGKVSKWRNLAAVVKDGKVIPIPGLRIHGASIKK